MYCPYCKNQLSENSKFCGNCGQPIGGQKTEDQTTSLSGGGETAQGKVIKNFFHNSFKGRIGRMRYLQGQLFVQFPLFIWLFVWLGVSAMTGFKDNTAWFSNFSFNLLFFGSILLISVFSLTVVIGTTVRRVHDIGHSGWFVLLSLIPLLGYIVCLYFLFKKGEPAANKYGPAPLYRPFFAELFNYGDPAGSAQKLKPDWGIRVLIIYVLLIVSVLFGAIVLVSFQRAKDANLVGWISYIPSDNTFIVSLPKEPTIQTSIDSPLETPMVSKSFVSDVNNNKAFIVNKTWYSEPIAAEPYGLIQNVLIGMIESEGSQIATTSYTYHKDSPALDYLITNDDFNLRGRIVVIDEHIFYILGESYAPNLFNEKEYQGFIESFAHTEQKPTE